jgi:hypothetical protein
MNELLEMMGNLQNCPWSNWAPATLHFCEAHGCNRIVAPAEAWSNLLYLIVGFMLIVKGLRARVPRGLANVEVRFGIYAVVVGTFSALFHASYTYVFETADLAAMNLVGVELVIQALRRLGWLKGHSPIALSAILFFAGLMLLLGTAGGDRLFVFGAFVAVGLWLEAVIFARERRTGTRGSYRGVGSTLVLFAVASAFWILDYSGLICAPDRHWFSGHAAWHVLSAGCFLTLSRFYRTRYA